MFKKAIAVFALALCSFVGVQASEELSTFSAEMNSMHQDKFAGGCCGGRKVFSGKKFFNPSCKKRRNPCCKPVCPPKDDCCCKPVCPPKDDCCCWDNCCCPPPPPKKCFNPCERCKCDGFDWKDGTWDGGDWISCKQCESKLASVV